MTVKIANKLPKSDTNGLAHLEGRFDDDRDATVIVVGIVQTDRVTEIPHNSDNPREVTVALLHVEPIEDDRAAKAIDKAMRQAYEKRTGKRELPFEDGDGGE